MHIYTYHTGKQDSYIILEGAKTSISQKKINFFTFFFKAKKRS